jgi:hypothetical protein
VERKERLQSHLLIIVTQDLFACLARRFQIPRTASQGISVLLESTVKKVVTELLLLLELLLVLLLVLMDTTIPSLLPNLLSLVWSVSLEASVEVLEHLIQLGYAKQDTIAVKAQEQDTSLSGRLLQDSTHLLDQIWLGSVLEALTKVEQSREAASTARLVSSVIYLEWVRPLLVQLVFIVQLTLSSLVLFLWSTMMRFLVQWEHLMLLLLRLRLLIVWLVLLENTAQSLALQLKKEIAHLDITAVAELLQ